MSKPRIRVINGTCLDVAEELRDWVECQGFEFVANREIDPFNLEEIIPGSEGFDGIIGPFYTPVIPRYFESLPDLK
ncbi:MAG: hypothetical protein KC978_22080, partial [Candidatus Omnitrophica bacterium]|nr:hypothetical protein [Candidatus Omnitrophota bacterium]